MAAILGARPEMRFCFRHRDHHPLRSVGIVTVVDEPAPLLGAQEMATRLRADIAFDSPMTDEDAATAGDIEDMIAAATAMFDGPSGILGRALGPQTLELSVDGHGQRDIELPYPPFISLVSVAQVADDGASTDVDAATYAVRRGVLHFPSGAPRVPELKIRYRAGYTDGASPETARVPRNLLAAIKLTVGDLWSFRETAADVRSSELPMSPTVERLIAPFKVYAA